MVEVKTVDYTRTGNVPIGQADAELITPPGGHIWELLSLQLEIPPEPLANNGNHKLFVRSEPPNEEPQYFYYRSNYLSPININRRSIISADLSQNPSDEVALGLTIDSIKFHSTEGVFFRYENHTDHPHTKKRKWRLRVIER